MVTSNLIIPGEPLSGTSSTNRNFYRLSEPTPTVLLLEPNGEWFWWLIGCLVCLLIVLAICIAKQVSTNLTLIASAMPLFGLVLHSIEGFCFHKFGTRARFDVAERQISITGFWHRPGLYYRLADVRAVQLCNVGVIRDRSWHAYQVNLIVQSTELTRVNLLDSGGEERLHAIAHRIADFLRAPLYNGSQLATSARV